MQLVRIKSEIKQAIVKFETEAIWSRGLIGQSERHKNIGTFMTYFFEQYKADLGALKEKMGKQQDDLKNLRVDFEID